MNENQDVWVTETYLRMQERIAARLVDMVDQSDRARHEVSLYGALSGLRRQLHERALCLRQDRDSLAEPSVLGSRKANADRPPIGARGERNRPGPQRTKVGSNSRRRGSQEGTLNKPDKDALRIHEYCIHKLRLVRRSVKTLGERAIHQNGAMLGAPSLDNKVSALGAARWCKVPWTRGSTNQLLRKRMGDPLYELCFAHSAVVKVRAKELKYDKPLTWGKMCILDRLAFALKVLVVHGTCSISATSPNLS